jgi:hypothetical protein
MAVKVRKQIYIEERQERLLKRQAKTQKVSEAELIRRAIDQVSPSAPRGGDHPEKIKELLAYAQRRLKEAEESGEAGTKDGQGTTWKWNRDELYEERLARYGKNMPD